MCARGVRVHAFQCSSASRKFLNQLCVVIPLETEAFQCSSASRKFLNRPSPAARAAPDGVSVLFSEPKIPQLSCTQRVSTVITSFSALQRAENSSMSWEGSIVGDLMEFQCSSASRKFLNVVCPSAVWWPCHLFQCSSASRKFLNFDHHFRRVFGCRFSALQRAENSSIQHAGDAADPHPNRVSVLFSEPKIPQFA